MKRASAAATTGAGREPLTPLQQRALEFIRAHTRARGAPPTVREIGRHLLQKWPRAAGQLVEILERKGYLTRMRGLSRNLRLTDPAGGIPLLGDVPAGHPLLAEENRLGALDPREWLGDAPGFAVRVSGHSMREAGIFDGDYVLVRQAPAVAPGAIGVVYVDGEATVKYVHPTRHGLRLEPANPDFKPLDVDARRAEIRIAGPVIGVLRRLPAGGGARG